MVSASSPQAPAAAIKVMLVDDSAIVRGLVSRILAEDPALTVAAQASNGEQAIAALARNPVDVVVLDIEMPVMDGLTALPGILKAVPGVKVIMLSSLTQRGATVTFQALRAGAADYIPKPSAGSEMSGAGGFKRELIDKIKSLAARKLRPAMTPAPQPTAPRPVTASPPRPAAIPPSGPVEVLAIGSSTGGPQALFDIFAKLRGVKPRVPILITQHMPPTFTGILAEHISQTSGLVSSEGKDGEKIVAGRVYVAPGGMHMLAERKGTDLLIRLSDAPPENFCKPAVDPMFRSVSAIWGNRAVAVVLTGMGSDGAKGGRVVAEAGGQLYAQDEATSVVYGMPAATAQTGLCKAILPLGEMGDLIRRLVG